MKKKSKTKASVKKKEIVVTRKWLMDFADHIYNPKTKQFLNLCTGTLQNGPDPKDNKRTMHCGLGELYFQLTGKQPNEARISEADVIDLVIERSSLFIQIEKEKKQFIKKVLALNSKKYLEDQFKWSVLDLMESIESDYCVQENSSMRRFGDILNYIPIDNDNTSPNAFVLRSRRVAASLRKAAKLLPA